MVDRNKIPYLPERIEGLAAVATNISWSWNRDARHLFQLIDDPLWHLTRHNPIAILRRIDPERLTGLVLHGLLDRDTFPLLFSRENCADTALSAADFDADFIASAQALLVTGTPFSTGEVQRASRQAMTWARERGTRVDFVGGRPVEKPAAFAATLRRVLQN